MAHQPHEKRVGMATFMTMSHDDRTGYDGATTQGVRGA